MVTRNLQTTEQECHQVRRKLILVLWLFNNTLRMLGLYNVERWIIVPDDKFEKKKWSGMRVFRVIKCLVQGLRGLQKSVLT